ncbi:uncharacterized protein LOC124127159 isoform X2 [Haliotis rufescens]|uniref:uncharacterized protein LOC124127159 isoform X2 n=1 Tax=Haliotis rufescens TaxID=6454 RepID=UPI00201F23E1|nr:uncharacterized protein LOC124127159 isoform X2 [Haliotis rufescens]
MFSSNHQHSSKAKSSGPNHSLCQGGARPKVTSQGKQVSDKGHCNSKIKGPQGKLVSDNFQCNGNGPQGKQVSDCNSKDWKKESREDRSCERLNSLSEEQIEKFFSCPYTSVEQEEAGAHRQKDGVQDTSLWADEGDQVYDGRCDGRPHCEASGGHCRKQVKCSRQESSFAFPLLHWAFGNRPYSTRGRLYNSLFEPFNRSSRNVCHCSECVKDRVCRSASVQGVSARPPKRSISKSQSLMLNRASVNDMKAPTQQVNHISLYDEKDERLALERWRNAGLALRRVLNSKVASKHRSGDLNGDLHGSGDGLSTTSSRERLAQQCQNVVDEIFDDVDEEDTLKNVGSSSTCSTSESPEVFSLLSDQTDQPGDQSKPASFQTQVVSAVDRPGIWDSQLYSTDISSQFDLSPDLDDSQPDSQEKGGEESFLFPWKRHATFLGACLFPQCMSMIGLRPYTSAINRSGTECNESTPECNMNSSKQGCDNSAVRAGGAMLTVGDTPRPHSGHAYKDNCDMGKSWVRTDAAGNHGRQNANRLSSNNDGEHFVVEKPLSSDSHGEVDRLGCVRLSSSQCTSSFHSEDGYATKSSGYHGDKGGDSDLTDNSSMCGDSGEIYFYEDNDKFDTVPRRKKSKEKAANPPKKTLQREKKKKLVHARKTHKRKSSSSSSDIVQEEGCHGNDDDGEDIKVAEVPTAFSSAFEPCPSFAPRETQDGYSQGQITPPRRTASVARHFLDRGGRTYNHQCPAAHNGHFRINDVTSSDLSSLPNFELAPLYHLPSFLESSHDSSLPCHMTSDISGFHHLWSDGLVAEPEKSVMSPSAVGPSDRADYPEHPEDQISFLEQHRGDNCFGVKSRLNGDVAAGFKDCQVDFKDVEDVEKDLQGVEKDLQGVEKDLQDVEKDLQGFEEDLQGFARVTQAAVGESDSVRPSDRGGNSLLSPDSWIRLIDEIYKPIVCESDAGEESALSDIEGDKNQDKTPDFFRCPDNPDKTSDSGDADDEFECECDHCQLLRNLDCPSHFLSAINSSRDTGRETGDASHRPDPWENDWTPSADDSFEINLDDLRPLEPFLLSLQDLPQDPVDLMFQNVITQMLAVHPELLGDQAPPPVPQTVIDSLPSLTATHDNIDDDLTCPVCLCHFQRGEDMTRLPCHHLYHPLCIQAWLAKSGTCPVCRHSLHNEGEGRSED